MLSVSSKSWNVLEVLSSPNIASTSSGTPSKSESAGAVSLKVTTLARLTAASVLSVSSPPNRISQQLATPSPSISGSQASPNVSPSKLAWSALASFTQLSALSPTLSASLSALSVASLGKASKALSVPSPSISESQASPKASRYQGWLGLH